MISSQFPRTRPTPGHQTATPARVPRSPRPRFDEPAHFRLLHHAHLILTSGESFRLIDAKNGGGVVPLVSNPTE